MHLYIYTFGDLLKVLDRALSDYFVRLVDLWKFNGFIYEKCWRYVESVRQSPI